MHVTTTPMRLTATIQSCAVPLTNVVFAMAKAFLQELALVINIHQKGVTVIPSQNQAIYATEIASMTRTETAFATNLKCSVVPIPMRAITMRMQRRRI